MTGAHVMAFWVLTLLLIFGLVVYGISRFKPTTREAWWYAGLLLAVIAACYLIGFARMCELSSI